MSRNFPRVRRKRLLVQESDLLGAEAVLQSRELSRRQFLGKAAAGAGVVALGAVTASVWSRSAQAASINHAAMHSGMHAMRATSIPATDVQQATQTAAQQPGSGVVNMDGDFYKSVRLPPKPNATPLLNKDQIQDLERKIACPCPCTLDVFTCRTTDFSCGNSPAVHADIESMVKGGYSADEIMSAMINTYGNNILMAPPKKGVNLVAWFAPFAALGAGAVLLNAVLRGWRKNSQAAAEQVIAASRFRPVDVNATEDEMQRLQKALRDEGR